jgi:hypothetical protein
MQVGMVPSWKIIWRLTLLPSGLPCLFWSVRWRRRDMGLIPLKYCIQHIALEFAIDL